MRIVQTLGILLFSCFAAMAQTQPDQVTVEVVATTRAEFEKGLASKDFKVWEDNKEQPLTGAALIPPGKHAVVLLFDNTTVPVRIQGDIRGYVSQFIDSAAGPDIYMEVANYFAGISILQPFTTDATLLKNSLTGTEATAVLNTGKIGGPVNNDPSVAMGRPTGAKVRDGSSIVSGNASPDNSMKSQAMMESLCALIESLAPIQGRKAIIMFSGGQTFSQDATTQVDAALDAANKANVAIYGIAASADNSGIAFAKTFADATGGTAIKQTPNLPEALHQIIVEQNSYYALSFTPASGGDPAGACHQLRVKSDAPGVDVRARKMYCAPKQTDALAGTPLGKALDAKLTGPAAGSLGASVQAPYFYSGGRAQVTVVLDAAATGIKFQKEKGKMRGELNAEGAAYRDDGTVAAHFSETIPFEMTDQKQADAFAKMPYHYENRLTLPPGKYTVRAILSPSADVWGKAEASITIDPLDNARLGMSGIALSRELRNAAGGASGLPADMIAGVTPLLAAGHQVVPTGTARFQKGERALFYAEIYDPALTGANPPQVSMRFRVLDRASGAVKSDSGVASVAGYVRPGNPVVGVASTVPVTGLPSGAYRLEITASHTSSSETAVRTVDFDLN